MTRRDALRLSGLLAAAPALRLLEPLAQGGATRSAAAPPQPFHIDYGRDSIDDLYRRLDAVIWPEMPFDTGWSAGTSDRVLRDLVRYWRHEYDWFSVQEDLNRLDHLHVPIEGERLHFVRYRGAGARHPPLYVCS